MKRVIFVAFATWMLTATMALGAFFTVLADGVIMDYMGVTPDTTGNWASREFIGAVLIIACLWLRSAYRWQKHNEYIDALVAKVA